MKFVGVLVIFTVLAYASAGIMPVYDGPTYELTAIDDPMTNDEITSNDETESNLPPIRQRRVTCDVFSWQSKWLSVNHSACAIKCLAQRRKGGRCRDGVCVCR